MNKIIPIFLGILVITATLGYSASVFAQKPNDLQTNAGIDPEKDACIKRCTDQLKRDLEQCMTLPPAEQAECRSEGISSLRRCVLQCIEKFEEPPKFCEVPKGEIKKAICQVWDFAQKSVTELQTQQTKTTENVERLAGFIRELNSRTQDLENDQTLEKLKPFCDDKQIPKWNEQDDIWDCDDDVALSGVPDVDWSNIQNIPPGLNDGDDDTIAVLQGNLLSQTISVEPGQTIRVVQECSPEQIAIGGYKIQVGLTVLENSPQDLQYLWAYEIINESLDRLQKEAELNTQCVMTLGR